MVTKGVSVASDCFAFATVNGKPFDNSLYLFVPILPFVATGTLLVVKIQPQLFSVLEKMLIGLVEKVLGPAALEKA
jgi:hypothetical protein